MQRKTLHKAKNCSLITVMDSTTKEKETQNYKNMTLLNASVRQMLMFRL